MAAKELEALGILHEPAKTILARMESRPNEGPFGDLSPFDPSEPKELTGVFSCDNNLLIFDVETSEIPCQHDRLISDFAKITRGRLSLSLALQKWHRKNEEDYESPYTIKFIAGKRLYEFNAENYGDWYDALAVQNALNFALADQGHKERFIPLAGYGQCAAYVFADPTVFLPFAQKYRLPIAKDATEANPRRPGIRKACHRVAARA